MFTPVNACKRASLNCLGSFMFTCVNTGALYSYSRGDDVSPCFRCAAAPLLRWPHRCRTRIEHTPTPCELRSILVRDGPRHGPAKPSGLGMVSMLQHAAICATEAADRRTRVLMWNMRRRHSSHSWISPAARTAVKGARSLRVHRSEAQTLDGHRSEGYAASAARFHLQPRKTVSHAISA